MANWIRSLKPALALAGVIIFLGIPLFLMGVMTLRTVARFDTEREAKAIALRECAEDQERIAREPGYITHAELRWYQKWKDKIL